MKFYHLTPISNVDNILKNGLIIGQKEYASIEDNSDKIYLTTSINKLMSQESEWNNNIAIFEINYMDIIGIEMQVDWEQDYNEEESPFSFYVNDNIKKIKLIGKIENKKIIYF